VAVHHATTRNFAGETENRIHSDEVAARFGFEGALVAGAAIFGHMTHPPVESLGTDWLSSSLHIVYAVDGIVATEIEHVAIFRIRGSDGA